MQNVTCSSALGNIKKIFKGQAIFHKSLSKGGLVRIFFGVGESLKAMREHLVYKRCILIKKNFLGRNSKIFTKRVKKPLKNTSIPYFIFEYSFNVAKTLSFSLVRTPGTLN